MKKNLISDMKYFLVLLAIGSFILIPIGKVNAATSSRFYAGYMYVNYDPDGVRANIYCVSPSVPAWHMRAHSVSAMLSYSPLYWLQIGYTKQNMFFYVIWNFYREHKDSTGYGVYRWGFPLSGHTYNFRIWERPYGLQWRVYEGSTYLNGGSHLYNPYNVIDLQALAETSKTSISIGNTHYSSIQYYTGSSWNLWSNHYEYSDDPYFVQEMGHYEFKAWRL